VGDFNARTTNEQLSSLCNKEDNNPLWLIKEVNQLWARCSKDRGGINHFGEELLALCDIFDLVICNGMGHWANSGNFTCKTYNVASVVDYIICSQSLVCKITKVVVEVFMEDLIFDHNPICLLLSWPKSYQSMEHKQHIHQTQIKGKILLTQENCNIFMKNLRQLMQQERKQPQDVKSHQITHKIQVALEGCQRAKNKKKKVIQFPTNAWFDEECKVARKVNKQLGKEKVNTRLYKKMVKVKK
jgi:hypothetical protein